MRTDESVQADARKHPAVKNVVKLGIFPKPSPDTREEVIMTPNHYIEKLTNNIIKINNDTDHNSVVDIEKLCKKLGGEVVIDQFFSFSEEIQILKKDSIFVITVPNSTTLARDRFTVAHELGHYLLHYILPVLGGEAPFAYRFFRRDSDRLEQQANWFAACLTMPREAFKERFKSEKGKMSDQNDYDIFDRLKNHFRVSRTAVQVRVDSLNLDWDY